MKKILFLIFIPSLLSAEGPILKQNDALVQREFGNVYQDIRNTRNKFSSYITNFGYINVKDDPYNAKCDGSTDDYSALYSAIQASQQRPWSCVLIPPGGCRTTQSLWISSSTCLKGMGPIPESNASNLFTGAGTANAYTGYPIIYFDIANSTGLLVQQASVGYAAQLDIHDLMFVCKDQASGTGAHGIVVQSADYASAGKGSISFQQNWDNVTITNCGGYGVWLKEGWYGSHFKHVRPFFSGLTGFRMEGTSQGETEVDDLRAFGNGTYGTTEDTQASFYEHSGGSGMRFSRFSLSGYKVHAYFDGGAFMLDTIQGESFGGGNNNNLRGIILKGCFPTIHGIYMAPPNSGGGATGFLGRILDFRSQSNSWITGFSNFSVINSTQGYTVYEDTNSGSNFIEQNSGSTVGPTNLQSGTRFDYGSSTIFNNPVFTGTATFPSGITAYPSIVFGATGTITNGIFSGGTNRIDFSNGGRNNVTFDYPGADIIFTTGSVLAPPVRFQNSNFSGQINVGMFNSAPNCEALTTNSASRLEICNSSITAKAGSGFYGDGTNLTGVSAGTFSGNYVASVATNASMKGGTAAGNAVAISLSVDCASGTCQGNTFNGAAQLTQTDSNGGLNLSLSTFSTLNTTRIRSSGTDWITFSSTGTAIKGCTTGLASSSGMYGQTISSITAAFTPMPTSNTWGDVASVALTAGCYMLSGSVEETANGATDSDYQCGYGLTAGNTVPAAPSGSNTAFGLTRFNPSTGAATADAPCMLPSYPVCVTSNTTYYFKILGVFTVATPKYSGGIYALRSN